MRLLALIAAAALFACRAPGSDVADSDSDVAEPDSGVVDSDSDVADSDVDVAGDPEVLRLPPAVGHIGKYAAAGVVCADCHSNADAALALRDPAGRGIAPVNLHRASMMAHAARDPFFRATLAVHMAEYPARGDEIARECLSCHAPAAWAEATLGGDAAPDGAVLHDVGPLGELARDGAGCVGCHLQDPDRQGDERFSGHHGFVSDRRMFGPHRAPEVGPMRAYTTFTPTYSSHLLDGALCAGCHTLRTAALGADGNPSGHQVMEQAPFLEWRSSAYNPARGEAEAASCQACHLPIVDQDGAPIRTNLARSPGGEDFPRLFPREPVGRHLLVGGNTFALALLRDYRDLMGSSATEAEFDASIVASRALLSTAANLEVLPATLRDGTVRIPLRITNLTGHKLPTGYPARRAFLHVRVLGPDGSLILESGATDPFGRILGAAGQVLASERGGAPEPHRSAIRSAADVVIWQSWLQDARGEPTTGLLRGAAFLKDNRILPAGFAPSEADAPWIKPAGVDEDPDFSPGGDTVDVVLVAPPARVTVEATVRYQAFSPSFLEDLTSAAVPEAKSLGVLVKDRPILVETLASVRSEVRTSP